MLSDFLLTEIGGSQMLKVRNPFCFKALKKSLSKRKIFDRQYTF